MPSIRFLLLGVCQALACMTVGQNAIIRGLKTELAREDLSMLERARKLERLSWYQCGGDPVSAMEAAQEAMALAERLNENSLLGSAIVRKIAAKQTDMDRGGDAEELRKAITLLQEHGPERDLGYAYWCAFMDLSQVAGQDSLRAMYNQRARALFDRHQEATGRYWVLSIDLYDEGLTPRTADSLENEIERIVRNAQDTFLLVDRFGVLFNAAMAREDFTAMERLAFEHLALSRAAELPREELIALSELEALAAYSGEHAEAIRYGLQALRLAERLRSTTYRPWMHSEIAARFADLGDHASAVGHLRQALSIDGGPKRSWDRFEILLNLGRSCLKTGRADTSLVVLHEAERRFSEGASGAFSLYESSLQAYLLQYLGTAYRLKGDLPRSRTYLEQALKVVAAPNMRMDAARIGVEHARTLALIGPAELVSAITELDSVIALSAREGWLEMTRDASLALYEVHDRNGDAAAALRNLQLYVAAKDSLLDLDRIEHVNLLNKRFESERKDAELKVLSETNTRQGEEIVDQRRRNTLLVAGIAVAALIGALLFALLRGARRSRKLLAEKNAAILDAQARLVESERAREASEVRTRIARDVHDQLGSDLTKLVLLSTEAREVAHTGTNGLPEIANDIERIAGEANRSLGDIVWAIDPHHDSLAGLTERVRAHCHRMLKWSKVEHTVDCVHEGPDRSLDPATKRDIYLMLREALNNAIKYAKAHHIQVVFHTSANRVAFQVKDDGVGMTVNAGHGHGLGNMRSRAERIGGKFDVVSAAGAGTRVDFAVSLPAE